MTFNSGPADENAAFDPNDPENWISLEYVHDRVLEELTSQERRWQEVDSRLRMVLGVTGIVFAVAGAFVRGNLPVSGALAAGVPIPASLPFWVGTAVDGAVVLYLIAGLLVAWAYRWRSFDRPVRPWILSTYISTDPREVKHEVIDTAVLAYYQNERVITTKLQLFAVSFVFTVLATILLGVALLMQVTLQTQAWGP